MAVIGSIATFISANTSGLTKGLGDAGRSISGFGSSLKGMMGPAALVGGALTALVGTIKGVTSVADQFGDIDRIAKAAPAIGVTTEELVGLEHAANLSGVASSSLHNGLKRLTREGMDISSFADQLAAIEDPAERAQLAYQKLGRQGQDLIPLLRLGGDAIREMSAEGIELGGFDADSAATIEAANDAISRMKLAFTGVARDLAIVLAPAVDWVGKIMTGVGSRVRNVFSQIGPVAMQFGNVVSSAFSAIWDVVSPVFSNIASVGGSVFTAIRDFALDWLITSEFVWQNFGDVASLAWESTKLAAVSFWAELEHLFTVAIPTTMTWLWDNFGDIAFTAFDYALTVAINFGSNLRGMFTALWDWISSGFTSELKIDWTPLSEGFVSTIKEMPEIPARELGTLEQELMANVDRMGGNLSGRLGDFMTQRRGELLGDGGEIDLKTPEIELSEGSRKMIEDGVGGVGVAQRGSAEAFSAIFSAMRNDRDPALKVQQDSLREQQRQTRLLERQSRQSSDGVELVEGSI